MEFALVAMLLVTLLLGIIQASIWFWAWQAGGHAAREAARRAAVQPCDTAAVQAAGTDAMTGAPLDGTASVGLTRPSPVQVGDDVTVAVTFTPYDVAFFPGFGGPTTKSATARVENVPAGGC